MLNNDECEIICNELNYDSIKNLTIFKNNLGYVASHIYQKKMKASYKIQLWWKIMSSLIKTFGETKCSQCKKRLIGTAWKHRIWSAHPDSDEYIIDETCYNCWKNNGFIKYNEPRQMFIYRKFGDKKQSIAGFMWMQENNPFTDS